MARQKAEIAREKRSELYAAQHCEYMAIFMHLPRISEGRSVDVHGTHLSEVAYRFMYTLPPTVWVHRFRKLLCVTHVSRTRRHAIRPTIGPRSSPHINIHHHKFTSSMYPIDCLKGRAPRTQAPHLEKRPRPRCHVKSLGTTALQ